MKDIFNGMGEFSIDVFHDATAIDHLIKLKIEVAYNYYRYIQLRK